MRVDIEALHQLARTAIEGPAAKETLALAASIIRRATGAAEVLVVYVEDQDFLTRTDAGDGAGTEFTPTALWIVQRQILESGGPVAFTRVGHRVGDFTNASSDDDREFLAFAVPTSQSTSEMCMLRGPWKHKARGGILRFMESAMPALTIILDRFLNAGRSRRQGDQLNVLANAAQVLTRSDDVQAALTDLATAIAESTGFDMVNIDMYDGTTGRFFLRVLNEQRHSSGTLAQTWRNSLNPERPEAWKLEVMRTRQPALAPDVQNDERVDPHVRQFFRLSLIRSVAIFPMLFQNEFLGTMGFVSFKPRAFLPDEVTSLQGFAAQAATAIKALQMHKELQRYAHELRRSADEYVATTNLTGDIIAKLDKRGRWTFLNDAACQFLGGPREELLGTNSRVSVHPDDLERTAQAIRETRARKELTTGFVNRHITPIGTRVVEWDGYPFFDEEGEYAGIQMTGRDITERRQMEEELAGSEERFRTLFEFAPDGYYLLDLQGRFVGGNKAAEQMIGYRREEIVGKNLAEAGLLSPEELHKAVIHLLRSAQELPGGPIEYNLIRKDGTRVPVEIRTFPVKIKEQTLILGIARDITDRKRAEEALRESEERYRLLAENASDLIWTMDMNLRYTYMSPSVEHMRGYTAEEVIGARVNETMTPASLEAIRKIFVEEMTIEREGQTDLFRSRTLEAEMYCKDGSTIWTELKLDFLRDSDGRPIGIMGVTRDIGERKKMEEERERLHAELELRAITDGLTGLYNHAHFYQRLAEEIERSKRYGRGLAVVMMDVDNFKHYNDSRGHQAGDQMLHLVAGCIRRAIRRSDLAFRYGGDEFAAILPHADSSKAQTVVDRISRRITKSLRTIDNGAAARLSLSAGVACFPDDGTTADELVRVADAALYSAKWVTRARDITKQQEDIESLLSAPASWRAGVEASPGGAMSLPEALQEQRTRTLSTVAGSLALALKDAGVSQALEDPDVQIVAVVGAAAGIKDRYIRGHPEGTSEQAVALAEQMGLSPERVRDIRIAGLLHDIGKVSVSESILNKPGKLTRSEFATIKDHPIVGATLVSQLKGFEQVVPIVRHHHERFDGTGYPDGLAAEDIPLEARILGVADVYDAMTHQRAYRKALSKGEAVAELERGAGTQFDPAVVKAFLALVETASEGLAAPTQAAAEGKHLAAARAPARRKG